MQVPREYEHSMYRVSNRFPLYIAWSDADYSVLNFFFRCSEFLVFFRYAALPGLRYLVSGWGCHLEAPETQLRFSLDAVTGACVTWPNGSALNTLRRGVEPPFPVSIWP